MSKPKQTLPAKPKYPLRLKLTLGFVTIIAIFFISLNWFNLWTHRKALQAEALTSRATVARLLYSALSGQLANDDITSPRIRNFLQNFLTVSIIQNKDNQDFAFALVTDPAGNLIAGRAKPQLTTFPDGTHIESESAVLAEVAKLKGQLGGPMRTTRINVSLPQKGQVGLLMVGISLERIEAGFRRDLLLNLAVFAALLLVLVVFSVTVLGRTVIRPITQVVKAMRHVHNGDLSDQVDIRGNDEMKVLADSFNFMVQGLREREDLKDAFSRYVSSKVYDQLKLGELRLSGELRHATILFSDIRGFTALSEQLAPQDVVSMLNEYFSVMVEIVFKHDGFLNKFIGDALMAVYNAPIDQDHPELRAVKTALEMQQALEALNADRNRRGQYAIKIGIGINSGPVIAGNIGHVKRLEYTVIGDTVNLTQRIESQTKVTGMPILISDTTHNAIQDKIVAQTLPPVKVKGKQEMVTLFAVTGLAQPSVHTP